MDALQILGVVLGSTVMVAIINLIADRLKRKDKVADKKDDTAEQITDLKVETAQQFIEVNTRIDGIENKVDAVAKNTERILENGKSKEFTAIRREGLKYVRAGKIRESDYTNLQDCYRDYVHMYGEDSNLEKVLTQVATLRIIQDGENVQ